MVFLPTTHKYGLFAGSVVKNSFAKQEITCNAVETVSIPGSGRLPRERNGKPLQYFCLGNLMDRGNLVGYSLWGHKIGHNLATKPPAPYINMVFILIHILDSLKNVLHQEVTISLNSDA